VIGAVLAGGASRRMGEPKTLVELDGRPLLLHPVEALLGVVDRVAVVCKPDTPLPALPPGVEVWHEEDPARHPLVGVVAALERADGPVLVCAGDMPALDAATLEALRDAPPATAVVAVAAGRLQPLLARYAPSALTVLRARGADEPATAVVERLDPVLVEVGERVVRNVNVRDEL
jgi:molybdopterin-guanine dinucleotide biosynthesis protein A